MGERAEKWLLLVMTVAVAVVLIDNAVDGLVIRAAITGIVLAACARSAWIAWRPVTQ